MNADQASSRWRSTVARVCLFGAVFFLCTEAGHQFLFSDAGLSTIWFPSGVLLGALLVSSPGLWPSLLAASLIATLFSKIVIHQGRPSVSAVLAVSGLFEAVLGATLVRRWLGHRPALTEPRDVLALLLTGLFASVFGALIGTLTLGVASGRELTLEAWKLWWAADALGIGILTPLLLAWVPSPGEWHNERPSPPRSLEFTLTCVVVAAVTWLLFHHRSDDLTELTSRYPLALILALQLWVAVRFEIRGATVANLCMALPIIWCTTRGYGLFTLLGQSDAEQALRVQAFLAVATTMTLTVSGSIERRRLAEALLRNESNELRQAEVKIREQRNVLRSILDNMGESVFVFDSSGHLTLLNPAARNLCVADLGGLNPECCFASEHVYLEDGTTRCHPDQLPLAQALRGEDCHAMLLSLRVDARQPTTWVRATARPIREPSGTITGAVVVVSDVTRIEHSKREQAELVTRLQQALRDVKTLRGLIPICAQCKKIRNDEGAWERLEKYLGARTEAEFSHGMCPECGVAARADAWFQEKDASLPD
jgi:integral membrane sensor domain MASE1